MEHGLQKVRSSSRAPAPAARRRSVAPGRRPRGPRRQGRLPAGPQRRPAEEAEARLMARPLGPKCKLCRREGMKLFLKGERCLTEKCAVERRSYPPGEHGRGRIKQSVPAPAAREAEGAPLLRPARAAVPQLLREGREAIGDHRRGAPAYAGDAPRQRGLPPRLRRLAAQARQLIRHGHFQVNGRRVNIPSFQVKPDDVVALKPGAPSSRSSVTPPT